MREHAHGSGGDLDTRTETVAPTSAQKSSVEALGALVRWNDFGTPASLRKEGGYLAEGLAGSNVAAARAFLGANAGLFRLSADSVAGLELIHDVTLPGTDAHSVLFRQRFGDLPAAQDGMVTVGVTGGKIAYVSSSLAGDAAAPASAVLSPVDAWLRAATNLGETVSILSVSNVRIDDGWTVFDVAGFAEPQRARLVALPIPGSGARAAFEANVVDAHGGDPEAFTFFVDAVDGAILFRQNRVDNLAAPQASTYSGSYTGASCGQYHDFTVEAGMGTIDVTGTATTPANDIVLELHRPQGNILASADTATSPEAIHYAPERLEAGVYSVRVCPYAGADPIVTDTYAGTITVSPISTTGVPYPPKWSFFTANPPLDGSGADTRILGCWESVVGGIPVPGCQLELQNLASRAPWDYDLRTNAPTFTTKGNNAISGEAWASPLTPAEQYRPVSASREYVFPFTNQWQTSKCSPSVFASAERNDVDAATTNLFVSHNRMHDWSYVLGFTERTYNMQDSNFGNTAPGAYPFGREADPEVGNVQAGAVSGGHPSYLGRDNANQITLQDGIAGVTNMYLWQPIAAAFYAPCVDGDYDMSVIGHEYTHAISNRMVGGPDAGLTGDQSRAMGESWSDLAAVEYLQEHGYVPTAGENPFSVGAYVTGNGQTGIRNYAMNASPLNYSNVGYDFVCNVDLVFSNCTGATQVHADGEIWSATNFTIREAFVARYGGGDATSQLACAQGELPADRCPGNRRWAQIMFDAFLLMQPDVSMQDARDAYLAADLMRFGGANQDLLWNAFATRGLGAGATTAGGDDFDPTPAFDSPLAVEGTLTFRLVDEGGAAVSGSVYVGDYEARVTPIADTDGLTALGDTAPFVAGTYDLVVQADGHGLVRTEATVVAGSSTTVTVKMPTNLASSWSGGTITGDGANLGALIDDTEDTNWTALGRKPSVAGTKVTVDLGGGTHVVDRVNVSAMLRQKDPNNAGDRASQNRFSALRAFEIWACNANAAGSANCTTDVSFQRIYSSTADAFPGSAPRPLAPSLILRGFDVPNTPATHVRLVVVANQCTGGSAFAGEQDDDPLNVTDCVAGSVQDENVRAAELQVFAEGRPNLTVTELRTEKIKGRDYRSTATVANNGAVDAGATRTAFRLDGTTDLCVVETAALAAGAAQTVTCAWTARTVLKGDHTVVATADSANAVAESDESDNARSSTVPVG